jgi:hypothetical protein
MRKPKSVTIAGHIVSIKYYDELEENHAAFYPDSLLIVVENGKHWKKHLFHEIEHAAMFLSGATNLYSAKNEEQIVSMFENSLFGIIKLDFSSKAFCFDK